MIITLALTGCKGIEDISSAIESENSTVVDKDGQNSNDIIVFSDDNYEIKIVGTVYNYSSKRSLLITFENKTKDILNFDVINIATGDIENKIQDGGKNTIDANSTENLPLVFNEWVDFEKCSGEFIVKNENETINESHEFNVKIEKSDE